MRGRSLFFELAIAMYHGGHIDHLGPLKHSNPIAVENLIADLLQSVWNYIVLVIETGSGYAALPRSQGRGKLLARGLLQLVDSAP